MWDWVNNTHNETKTMPATGDVIITFVYCTWMSLSMRAPAEYSYKTLGLVVVSRPPMWFRLHFIYWDSLCTTFFFLSLSLVVFFVGPADVQALNLWLTPIPVWTGIFYCDFMFDSPLFIYFCCMRFQSKQMISKDFVTGRPMLVLIWQLFFPLRSPDLWHVTLVCAPIKRDCLSFVSS